MPQEEAARFAAAVARRCGEIAATLELPGEQDFETLAMAEAIGAKISEAIALEFPAPGTPMPRELGPGGIGIGGPSKL